MPRLDNGRAEPLTHTNPLQNVTKPTEIDRFKLA